MGYRSRDFYEMAHHEHDDFGGLHRDLVATGAAMNRRGLLRLAAGIGAGLGAIHCSAAAKQSDGTDDEH